MESLDALYERMLGLLHRAVVDRKSPFRTPVVCTTSDAGAHGRVMVLRALRGLREVPTLVFHTDARTPKTSQLTRDAEVVFWDSRKRIQVRARGSAALVHPEAPPDLPGEGRDYRTLVAPGTPAESPDAKLGEAVHFVELHLTLRSLEWLALRREGHRRARFDATTRVGEWLVP
ncbi:MAG: hypothetical protein AAF645_13290 [Myxococcota bacterium]